MALLNLAVKGVPHLLMAGPKVLVPLAAGAVIAVGAGAKGVVDLLQGGSIRKGSAQRLDVAIAKFEAVRLETEGSARTYGEHQMVIHKENVGRFADWLERTRHS